MSDQELERKVESNGSGKSGDRTPEEIALNTRRSNQGRLCGGGGTGSKPRREESWEEETETRGVAGRVTQESDTA